MANVDPELAGQAAALLRFREAFAPPRSRFLKEVASEYPLYDDDVVEFFRLAGAKYWCKFDYSPAKAMKILQDDASCSTADLEEVRGALTACVRAERFGMGAWEALLTSGRVQRLLGRLAELVGPRE